MTLTPPSEDDIRRGGFSTPWDAPMVPPFPFRFRNAEILTVYWRTDPAKIAFLLPPPLRPEGDIVCAHIYKMNDTDWLGPYSEANVMVGAALGDRRGAYSPYLVLSSDIGVAHGRRHITVHHRLRRLHTRLDQRLDQRARRPFGHGIDPVRRDARARCDPVHDLPRQPPAVAETVLQRSSDHGQTRLQGQL